MKALERLLPWLNGDRLSAAQLRRRLGAFLRAFDGSPAAGYLRVYADAGRAELEGGPRLPPGAARRAAGKVPYDPVEPADDAALERVGRRVLALVRKGFPYEAGQEAEYGERLEAFPSLRLGVRRVAPAGWQLRRAARQRYRTEPGAYEVLVDGELRDLVPYLVLRLLTGPGAAMLARCPGPERGSRGGRRCGRLFTLKVMGRPRKFCSGACKVRAFAERTEGRLESGHRRPR